MNFLHIFSSIFNSCSTSIFKIIFLKFFIFKNALVRGQILIQEKHSWKTTVLQALKIGFIFQVPSKIVFKRQSKWMPCETSSEKELKFSTYPVFSEICMGARISKMKHLKQKNYILILNIGFNILFGKNPFLRLGALYFSNKIFLKQNISQTKYFSNKIIFKTK